MEPPNDPIAFDFSSLSGAAHAMLLHGFFSYLVLVLVIGGVDHHEAGIKGRAIDWSLWEQTKVNKSSRYNKSNDEKLAIPLPYC